MAALKVRLSAFFGLRSGECDVSTFDENLNQRGEGAGGPSDGEGSGGSLSIGRMGHG